MESVLAIVKGFLQQTTGPDKGHRSVNAPSTAQRQSEAGNPVSRCARSPIVMPRPP